MVVKGNNKGCVRPVIIGNWGPPVLACIRSWYQIGLSVGFICINSTGNTIPKCNGLAAYTTLPQVSLHKEHGLKIIKKFLRSFRADGLTCIDETITAWINQNRDYFSGNVTLWVPPAESWNDILSKKRQIEVAQAVGMSVLPTYLLGKNLDVSDIEKQNFPLCLRPSDPGCIAPMFKVQIVHTPDALLSFIKGHRLIGNSIIAQPFKSLPNIVVHGSRNSNDVVFGLQSFIVERKFEGVTLTIRPFYLGEGLRKNCERFLATLGVIGPFHFEFLFDPFSGKIWFLEINNRFGGTTAKVVAIGYNEPGYALKAYGADIEVNENVSKDVTVSNKQALLKYLYCILSKKLTPFDYPEETMSVRLIKTLHAFFFCEDDVFSFQDLKGSWSMYWGNIRDKIATFSD